MNHMHPVILYGDTLSVVAVIAYWSGAVKDMTGEMVAIASLVWFCLKIYYLVVDRRGG